MKRCSTVWLAVVLALITAGCSDDEFEGTADSAVDMTPVDTGPPTPDLFQLPDGYGQLYSCKTPGQSCNAHDPCALNPICGPDKKCRPTGLQDCNDKLSCTTDTCAGLGVCKNTPTTGTCLLAVRVNSAADGGMAADSGAAADAGTKAEAGATDASGTPDAGSFTTEQRCFKTDDPKPTDPCVACKPSTNQTKWTAISGGKCDDGNSCTKDDTCVAGTCKGTSFLSKCSDSISCTQDICDGKGGCGPNHPLKTGWCLINKSCYKDGGKHPSGSCFECDVSKNTAGWTAIGNTCLINNKCYKKGDKNTGGCAQCDPLTSTSKWTVSGTTHCLIGTKCVASGIKDSTGCATCDPKKAKYAYTPLSGMCKISTKCYTNGTAHPKGCAKCKAATSATTWTLTSTTDCLINHECHKAKATFGCFTCDPTKSQTAWTQISGCTNLETSATATSSGGGTTSAGYGPALMNDGKGQTSCKAHWLSATSTAGSKWIQYTWAQSVVVGQVKFDTQPALSKPCVFSAGRTLAGGTLQYWKNGAWSTIGKISGKTDDWFYSFTPVTTNKIRLYGAHSSKTSNPVIYEWLVFSK